MKIVIYGCGWLGQQIGEHFRLKGHKVFGSYRSEESKEKLIEKQITPFYHAASKEYSQISNEITDNTDLLIISVPPIRNEDPATYSVALQNVLLDFPDTSKVIFTSSTGIYPKVEGTYNEDYNFTAEERLNVLHLAEKGLRSIAQDRLTILRLSGLVGHDRHPIKFLAGRNMHDNGRTPVALVHSEDIIGFIELLIEKGTFGEIFNLSYPGNQLKCDYYLKIAKALGLLPPNYADAPAPYRFIDSQKSQNDMGFSYDHEINDAKEFNELKR